MKRDAAVDRVDICALVHKPVGSVERSEAQGLSHRIDHGLVEVLDSAREVLAGITFRFRLHLAKFFTAFTTSALTSSAFAIDFAVTITIALAM